MYFVIEIYVHLCLSYYVIIVINTYLHNVSFILEYNLEYLLTLALKENKKVIENR